MAALVSWLCYSGARTSSGAVVASGYAYFYEPGTGTTQVTVYSDPDETSELSQPVSLDAGGRAEVYVKEQCRIEIQSAAGASVTVLGTDDRSNAVSADQVEIAQDGWTGTDPESGSTVEGGRTDLGTALANLVTSHGGTDGYYQAAEGNTSRTVAAAVGRWLSPSDFGAKGDAASDDASAWQGCITAAMSSNKKIFVEPGTYLIYTALTATGSSVRGLHIEGANAYECVLKNMSTSATVLTLDLSSAIESYAVIRNLNFTANTTSSGTALKVTNGDGVRIENVITALHRTGIDVSAVSHAHLEDCVILSTDSNASGIGIKLGANATSLKCRVAAATNGTGIVLSGTHGRMIHGYVTGATTACSMESTHGSLNHCDVSGGTTGISITGAYSRVSDSYVTGATTAYSIAGADSVVSTSFATGATTGFSVGAVARAGCMFCSGSSNTTDFLTNSSSTSIIDMGNTFATRTANELGGAWWLQHRPVVLRRTRSTPSGATSYTPDPTYGLHILAWTQTAGSQTLTINATSTTDLQDGQVMIIVIQVQASQAGTAVSFNSQYATTTITNPVTDGQGCSVAFQWIASLSRWTVLWGTQNGGGTVAPVMFSGNGGTTHCV